MRRSRAIPPRPDLGGPPVAPPRRPAAAWGVGLVVLSIVAGVVAGRVGREAPGPAPRPSSSPAGSSAPEARADPPAAYRFLDLVAGGGPRRWDPCAPISYRLNVRGAPRSAAADLAEAFDRAAEATGIRFVDRGRVSLPPLDQAIGTVELGTTLGADIHVAWLPHDRFVGFLDRFGARRNAVAVGIPFAGSGTTARRWVGGLIVVDAGAGLRAGFGSGYGLGAVLQHEIGHVLGLAHVRDREQLMYAGPAVDASVRDWGSGDLAGLTQLGRGAGCRP